METRINEIQGSEFYMRMSCHIPQLVPCDIAVFLIKHFIFLENGKNCHSIVFTVLQIHISVWPSGCVFRSYSCSNLIALSQVRVSKVSNALIFFLQFCIGVLSQSLSLLIYHVLFLMISVTVLIEKLFFIIKVFLLHFQ